MSMKTLQSSSGAGNGRLTRAVLDGPCAVWHPIVAGLLERQSRLCERLESLSREQAGHVKEGRGDALVGVLADRQHIIDEVLEVGAALDPFRAARAQLLRRLGPAERTAVEMKIEQIASSIERVRVQDEADRAELEARRRGVADELAGLVRGRGAVAAYRGHSGVGAERALDSETRG